MAAREARDPGDAGTGDAGVFTKRQLQAMQTLFGRVLTPAELNAVHRCVQRDLEDTSEVECLSDAFEVEAVTSVVFTDAWTGYTAGPSPTFSCRLDRAEDGGLAGNSTLSLPSEGGGSTNVSYPVKLTPRQVTTFLKRLGKTVLRAGEYEPLELCTDDYPNLELVLQIADSRSQQLDVAVLYTASQGEFHAPWGVFASKQIFRADGEEIGRALGAVQRHFRRRFLERAVFG